jgi:DNA-binding CsgD family transcriptional regulator
MGFVIETNVEATQLFDDEVMIKRRKLMLKDKTASAHFERLVDRLRTTSDTDTLPADYILVRSLKRSPIVIRALPVCGTARNPFVGARALLLLTDSGRRSVPKMSVIAAAFGLSTAESRIAEQMAMGISPEEVAENLGISRETARTQLKAVFAKTGKHRQSALVALLSRF